jgi:hypothetical protein
MWDQIEFWKWEERCSYCGMLKMVDLTSPEQIYCANCELFESKMNRLMRKNDL